MYKAFVDRDTVICCSSGAGAANMIGSWHVIVKVSSIINRCRAFIIDD